MPIFKNHAVFEVARNLKAFLNLEAGITRGEIPKSGMLLAAPSVNAQAQELDQLRQQLAKQNQRLAQVRQQLTEREQENAKREQENAELRTRLAVTNKSVEANEAHPENIVWIFTGARSGSTWLSAMMGATGKNALWSEPLVAEVLGFAHTQRLGERHRTRPDYVFSDQHKDVWLRSVRNLILDGATARFAGLRGSLVVQEPNCAVGVRMLSEALPGSRMVFLVRDPRDVVASLLDANRKGGWLGAVDQKEVTGLADTDPDAFVRRTTGFHASNMARVKQAYERHRGPKITVRYEDLRAAPVATLGAVFLGLGIPQKLEDIAAAVEEHSWERIPTEKKGPGKFRRKASPGAWKEDLTEEQARIVEDLTGPLLREFYP